MTEATLEPPRDQLGEVRQRGPRPLLGAAGRDEVAGLAHGRGAALHDHVGAQRQRGRDLSAVQTVGADRTHHGVRGHQLVVQHRRRRRSDAHDHVGTRQVA